MKWSFFWDIYCLTFSLLLWTACTWSWFIFFCQFSFLRDNNENAKLCQTVVIPSARLVKALRIFIQSSQPSCSVTYEPNKLKFKNSPLCTLLFGV